MQKKRRYTIGVIIIVWIAFFITDFSLAKANRSPIFAIPVIRYKDGGSTEYYGLGYKVIKYVNLTVERGPEVEKVDFGHWFMKFLPSESENTVSGLNVLEGSKTEGEYYFEPNVSVIEGTLITRLHYGPPGYGEDPDKDEKVYPFILLLDDPIKVNAEDTDMINSNTSDVSEIQLVLRGSPYVDMAKQYKNKHIKVQGTLFSAFTGHHYTEVLIVVDEILN